MMKRTFTSLIAALVLLASLTTGMVVSGAQQPPDLTETYVWQPYGLTVNHPAGWTHVARETAVSLHPDGLDVSDGFGPELVLFEQPGTAYGEMNQTIEDFAQRSGAQVEFNSRYRMGRAYVVQAALTWTNPAASGEVMLIQNETNSALGAAYIVRDSDAAEYGDALAAMFDSVVLGTASVSGSASVTSVRLEQPYVWADAGLTLHFPAAWTVEPAGDLASTRLYAIPDDLSSPLVGFVGMTVERDAVDMSLRDLLDYTTFDYDEVIETTRTTIAGYEGIVADVRDRSVDGALVARVAALDVVDQDVIAVLAFVVEESAWDDYRPLASAFIGSVGAAPAPQTSSLMLVANTQNSPFGLPRQDAETKEFVWDAYGVSLTIPSDWESMGYTQDYDLALVSPGAIQSGAGGFLLFNVYPSLGPGVSIDTALQTVADDVDGEVVALDNGYRVTIEDDASGTVQILTLYPYGNGGGALFVQASAQADDQQAILDIVDTLTIDAPQVDVDAANAAFQQSLEAGEHLAYGDADAPMVIREYFSYTCGHCANYVLPVGNLLALDVEAGRVRFEFASLAGDDKTRLATLATYCAAEQGKGYSMYKALFNDYLTNGYENAYTQDSVAAIIESDELGLDVDAMNTCIEDETYASRIDDVGTEFTDFGLTGTPTLVMGADASELAPLTFPDGQVWSGTIPLQALRDVIDSVVENGIAPQEAANNLFEQ